MKTREMNARGTVFVAGVFLVAGCVGHLEFDPHVDAGTASPITNNGSGNNTGSSGSGGWAGGYGSGGAASQAPAGSGGNAGGGGGSATGGASGNTAPWPDGGGADSMPATGYDSGAVATDGGTSASGCPAGVNVLTDIFAAKCGGCHGAASPTKNLDLVSAGLGARMVNKTSTCKSQPLIAGTLTGTQPSGLLFQKLAGAVTGCGVQMPAGATPLSSAEIACVNDWAVAAIHKVTGM
ncbi:MAG: hypothetical protein QOI66_645 [Myxococcales bacterium]|jgi:hypothetical protein|nr:hypothetical protein [Myxococcales bacterium]